MNWKAMADKAKQTFHSEAARRPPRKTLRSCATSPRGKALSLIKPRMPQRHFASRARTGLIRLTRNLRVGARCNNQTETQAVTGRATAIGHGCPDARLRILH